MICDKIVFGVRDNAVQEGLLREADLSLERAVDICRTAETSKMQYLAMSSSQSHIHAITTGKKSWRGQSKQPYKYHVHPPRKCLAYGKKCKQCNGMNHFANVCQGGGFRKSSKPVHTLRSEADIEGTGDDGQLFVGTLFIGDIQANDWQTKLRFSDTPVTFKLDTGAQANVLPVNVYGRIKPNKPLARTRTVLTAFGDAQITQVGETQLRVTCPVTGRSQLMKFFVTDTADIAIFWKDEPRAARSH